MSVKVKKKTLGIGDESALPDVKGIVVCRFCDADQPPDEIKIQTYGQRYTAEELCLQAAKSYEIGPLAFHLLALYSKDLNLFYPPNQEFICEESPGIRLWLRIRFIPSENQIREMQNVAVHGKGFDYLFLQLRADFIADQIRYETDVSKLQDHLLGLGVLDLLRLQVEHNWSLQELQRYSFKNLIPASSKNSFKMPWDKTLLSMNFKKKVTEAYESGEWDKVDVIKISYILDLIKTVGQYGVEHHELEDGDYLVIDPYHKRMSGLSIVEKGVHKHVATFDNIMSISVNPYPGDPETETRAFVLISLKEGGPPISYLFKNKAQAVSFIALIDGYYRLSVDFHFSLSDEVKVNMLQELRRIQSHGPVEPTWGQDRLLKEYRANQNTNFLLRQSRKDFGYVLTYIDESKNVVMRRVHQLQGDSGYQLDQTGEPVFPDMHQLINHYKSADSGADFKLEGCVRPYNPVDGRIYLCCKDPMSKEQDVADVKPDRSPITLVPSVLRSHKKLGDGEHTVINYSKYDKDGKMIEVAVKCLKEDKAEVLLKPFSQAMNRAIFWHHSSILSVHALCLHPFSVLMEKAQHGSLLDYLRQPKDKLYKHHLLYAAEQVTQALRYLQEDKRNIDGRRGEIHGNIRAKNVLVFEHSRKSIVVKLADPGLIHHYNKQNIQSNANIERLPWIAPELYSNLEDMSLNSDRYSMGSFLWELFSLGDRPFKNVDARTILISVLSGNKLPTPKECPPEITSIIHKCWDLVPANRMQPKEIIRDILQLVNKGDPHNIYNEPHWDEHELVDPNSKPDHNIAQQVNSLFKEKSKPPRMTLFSGRPQPSTSSVSSSTTSMTQSPDQDSMTWNSQTPLIGNRSNSESTTSPYDQSPLDTGSSQVTLHTNMSTSEVELAVNGAMGSSRPLPPVPVPIIPSQKADNSFMILPDRLQITVTKETLLGSGHYGFVHSGHFLNDNGTKQKVAVKLLKKEFAQKYASEWDREIKTMGKLEHQHIVKMIGQCAQRSSEHPLLLVMEFVENGCLQKYLRRNKHKLTADDLIRYSMEIALAMEYLGSNNIIHRDLAARNVLVSNTNRMKISDFGLSHCLEEKDYYKIDSTKMLPAYWCAPEVLAYGKVTLKSDVWSYGVTIWEVFTKGDNPKFCEAKDIVKELLDKKRLAKPKSDCPDWMYHTVMMNCWQIDQKRRLTFSKIIDIITQHSGVGLMQYK